MTKVGKFHAQQILVAVMQVRVQRWVLKTILLRYLRAGVCADVSNRWHRNWFHGSAAAATIVESSSEPTSRLCVDFYFLVAMHSHNSLRLCMKRCNWVVLIINSHMHDICIKYTKVLCEESYSLRWLIGTCHTNHVWVSQ